MKVELYKLPIFKRGAWAKKSDFPILNILRDLVWVLRFFSVAPWLSVFFNVKVNGTFYTHRKFSDIFLIAASSILFLHFILLWWSSSNFLAIFPVMMVADSLQYQIRVVFLRTVFQDSYAPYSGERTLAVLMFQYVNLILCFAIIYVAAFGGCFQPKLTPLSALEFSVVTITTLGYGNITATPGSMAALMASFQVLSGVFFLGVIISTAISRTRPVVALDRKNKSESLQERYQKSIDACGYREHISYVANIFGEDAWIVGGWVRNAALGSTYCGDIDFLISMEHQDIESRLINNKVEFSKNRFGTFRTALPDGNHMDLVSTFEHGGSKNVITALKNFNFSVNAAAINISNNRLICSEQFNDDISSLKLRVNNSDLGKKRLHTYSFLKDYEVLKYFYGLKPVNETMSNSAEDRISVLNYEIQTCTERELLEKASEIINEHLKINEAWLVRGYARCSIFGELKYWDDLDVIVPFDRDTLISHLENREINYSLNHFGNPKVFLQDGCVIDIWSLKDEQTITEAVEGFVHNIDMIAWSISDKEFTAIDLEAYSERRLEVNLDVVEKLNDSDKAYAILKTIYLLIRHNMIPGTTVADLFSLEIKMQGISRKHAIQLSKELSICGISNLPELLEYLEPNHNAIEAIRLLKEVGNKRL
jgi:hypothetical protein